MKKSLIVLCVLAICSVVWAEGNKQTEQQKEKPDYRSVIVDAWLIRVNADALTESGVKPLSEKDKENVSVMNLMWCLSDSNTAEVMSSATTKSYVGKETVSQVRKIQNIKRDPHNFQLYESVTELENTTYIIDNKKVMLEFVFKTNYISMLGSDSCPDEIKIKFDSTLIQPIQKTIIAAQSQMGSNMFFLVMKAEIVE